MGRTYPKIDFRYSSIYNEKWRRGELGSKKSIEKYPDEKEVLEFMKKAEKRWEKYEDKILPEISNLTSLSWKEDFIYCFMVGDCRPFPFPLTLPVFKNVDDFVDVLTHELIHRFFVPESIKKRVKKVWEFSNSKYSEESLVTRMHIWVYAFHSSIYLRFFSKERIKRNIQRVSRPDYKRAWEIVQEQGYKNIIKEFTKRLD